MAKQNDCIECGKPSGTYKRCYSCHTQGNKCDCCGKYCGNHKTCSHCYMKETKIRRR